MLTCPLVDPGVWSPQPADLLSKQYLLLPLVAVDHASLIIVCQTPPPGAAVGDAPAGLRRCILHLDSGEELSASQSVGRALAR